MKKGVISLAILLGVTFAVLVSLIVGVKITSQKAHTTIEGEIIDPTVMEITANAFMSYVPEESKYSISKLISIYMATSDKEVENIIRNSMKEVFPEKRVELKVNVHEIDNGIEVPSGKVRYHITSRDAFTTDHGIREDVVMRFYL